MGFHRFLGFIGTVAVELIPGMDHHQALTALVAPVMAGIRFQGHGVVYLLPVKQITPNITSRIIVTNTRAILSRKV